MKIDLARCPEFVVGGLTVTPALREVRAGDRCRTLEPRVMQVLIVLAEAGGRVVSRDELVARCWDGLAVGEGAIYRVVGLLRTLGEDFADGALRIETVAKVGYRLVASAPSPPSSRLPAPAAAPLARLSARTRRRLVWAALILALTTQTGAEPVGVRQHPRWRVDASRKLLPELAGDANPRFSSDGSLLAYTAGAHTGHGRIYVRTLAGGAPKAVSPPGENADSPAWASDGTRLAYVVADPDGAPCRVMVAAFPDGAPRLAGRCGRSPASQIAWQPGTPYLFLEDDQSAPFFSAIFRLDVETGGLEQVTTPLAAEADFGARVSPDGARLAYIRGRGFAAFLRVRNLSSGEEREIACDPDVTSVDWASDSRSLIAAVPGPAGGEIRAYPVDGSPGHRVYASASAIGRLATGPDGALAAEIDERRTALARASAAPRASVDLIDPAAGAANWPAFAPDGTLAFVSDRSGGTALWTRKPGGRPIEIVNAGEKDIERPVWSPDGGRIAYFGVWKGDITVHVVTAQGEEIVSFAVPSIGFGLPNWTPDGEHLVLFDRPILQPVRIDLRDPGRRQPVEGKLQTGITYHDGATYSVRAQEPGIWRQDGGPRLVTPNYPAARSARLAFSGDDVLLPGTRDGDTLRILAQPLAGGQPRLAFYAPAAMSETPFAVDPLTGDVVYVAEVAVDDHIELLRLAEE